MLLVRSIYTPGGQRPRRTPSEVLSRQPFASKLCSEASELGSEASELGPEASKLRFGSMRNGFRALAVPPEGLKRGPLMIFEKIVKPDAD